MASLPPTTPMDPVRVFSSAKIRLAPDYPHARWRHATEGLVEIEIGIAKSGRRAWGFDDIAIVPSRRTRDPEDVDLSWEIDAFTFDLPLLASGMDSAVSPATAITELAGWVWRARSTSDSRKTSAQAST